MGHALAAGAGHQHVHLAAGVAGELDGGGHGAQRRVLQFGVVVFREDEDAHAMAPCFFSASTSSSTLFTLMPAVRLGGS